MYKQWHISCGYGHIAMHLEYVMFRLVTNGMWIKWIFFKKRMHKQYTTHHSTAQYLPDWDADIFIVAFGSMNFIETTSSSFVRDYTYVNGCRNRQYLYATIVECRGFVWNSEAYVKYHTHKPEWWQSSILMCVSKVYRNLRLNMDSIRLDRSFVNVQIGLIPP